MNCTEYGPAFRVTSWGPHPNFVVTTPVSVFVIIHFTVNFVLISFFQVAKDKFKIVETEELGSVCVQTPVPSTVPSALIINGAILD